MNTDRKQRNSLLKKSGLAILLIGSILGGVWYFFDNYNDKPLPTSEIAPNTHDDIELPLLPSPSSYALEKQIKDIQGQIDAIQEKIDDKTPVPVLSLISELDKVQGQFDAVHRQLKKPPLSEMTELQTQIDEQQERIKQIYRVLVKNIQEQIDAIQEKMGKTPVISLISELDDVQGQLDAVHRQLKKPPLSEMTTELQTLVDQKKRIELIYSQLVKEIQSHLDAIPAQIDLDSGTSTVIDMTTQIEEVQGEIWAIHGQISTSYGKHSSLYALVDKQQTQIEQFDSQLVENIQKQIEAIQTKPIRGTSAVISLTTKLEDIQGQVDAVQKLFDKLYETPHVIALQKLVEKQHAWIEQTYRRLVSDIQKQIEGMPADKCTARRSSLHSQLDALQTQIEAIQQRIGKSIKSPEMAALKTRIDVLHRRIIRYLTEIASCSCINEVPKCLSSASPEIRNRLHMHCVPAVREKSIPRYLHDWMKEVAHSKITESEFFIMRREVKVGEFRHYVKTLDNRQRERLGNEWSKDDEGKSLPDENPVAWVPWWAAKGYADWFSEQTGCPLLLPTYNQWVAAAISYADPKIAVIRDKQWGELKPQQRADDGEKNTPSLELLIFGGGETDEAHSSVLDLLGNLREWSIDNSDQCPDSSYHYLLGEDYKTWRKNIAGEPICESGTLDTVGFRLILQ